MERRISVKFGVKNLCLSLIVSALFSQAAVADDALVLISSTDSSIKSLTSLEIRKLYLGLTVTDDEGNLIRAVVNDTDVRLMDIFLQNVMAMSQSAYNRRLLTLTLQTGRRRPAFVSDGQALHSLVENNRFLVTCVWKSEVTPDANVKIIKVLWSE